MYLLNKIWKTILILVGMIGIRLEKVKILWIWIPLAIFSYLLSEFVYLNNLWIPYAIFGWTFYYIGNSLILGTNIKLWMIKKFGKDKAYSIYSLILGLMFMNGGFAITQFVLANQNTFNIPEMVAWTLGIILFIFSFGVKFWSTWISGLDIYYYKNLFLNEKGGKFIQSGPYKTFKNPMYGIGNIYGYVGAIVIQSLEGLIFFGICHLSIYIFYYLIEKPFIKKKEESELEKLSKEFAKEF